MRILPIFLVLIISGCKPTPPSQQSTQSNPDPRVAELEKQNQELKQQLAQAKPLPIEPVRPSIAEFSSKILQVHKETGKTPTVYPLLGNMGMMPFDTRMPFPKVKRILTSTEMIASVYFWDGEKNILIRGIPTAKFADDSDLPSTDWLFLVSGTRTLDDRTFFVFDAYALSEIKALAGQVIQAP